MNEQLKIIHLEDSRIDAELVAAKLQEDGVLCVIDWVDTEDDFTDRLEQGGFDLILADYTLPSFDGLTALRMTRERYPDLPFIFVSGTIGEDRAVETFKNGATDYVLKGHLSRLAPSVRRALKEEQERTERRRAEEALRQSESRFSTIFRSSPIGIVLSRLADGTFLEVNDAFLNVYGYAREELIGHTSLEINMWVDPEDRAKMVRVLCEKRRVEDFEAKFRKKSGEIGDLLISAERIELSGEECLLGMFSDVSERKQAEEAVRKSEKKYQDLVNSTLDGIFRVDAQGAFIFMNQAGADIFGFDSPQEMIGKDALEFWRDPKDRDVYRTELSIHKKLSSYPMRARKKGGEPIELESSTRIIEDEQGNFLGIEGILRDVTVRKRAEEELELSVHVWNNTFDAMKDAISIVDEQESIVRCNKAMIHVLDKFPQEILGHPYCEVVFGAKTPLVDCPFTRMKRSRRREAATVQRFGRWFTIVADPIIDQAGRLTGGVLIMTDITEHRSFDEKLRESEDKFRSLAEQSLVGTYIIQDGVFKYVNPRFAEMFGYSPEEILGHMGPRELALPEDRHIIDTVEARAKSGEEASHYEARGLKRSGETIHAEIFGSRAHYQGRPSIIGILLDITEKKKLETQLLQAQKMEAVGQLTGGIAHDFNNILSAIIGYASFLQMKMKHDDPLYAYVDQILAGGERAANLTRSLLTFSRKQITTLAPLNVNDTLRKVQTFLRRIIGEDIDLRSELSPRDLIVNADAGQIEQMLLNLATNARDAMPNGGVLSLRTEIAGPSSPAEKPRAEACITVIDTGIGMDPATREKIFEPFFTTKELGRGTGLGLAMVYGIIQQHGGRIECISKPGKGTTFRIYLPLSDANEGGAAAGRDVSATTGLPRGSETILVVEDDDAVRRFVKITLESFGYRVIEAADGDEAIALYGEHREEVQLVLCDVIMPKKSGAEVHQAIIGEAPGARFLFMSGYPADIVRRQDILKEGTELISKPVTPSMLLNKVRKILDRR